MEIIWNYPFLRPFLDQPYKIKKDKGVMPIFTIIGVGNMGKCSFGGYGTIVVHSLSNLLYVGIS